jgi:cyclophilin family peptidyl-prolyl cis-trans isomerase
MAFAMLVSPQGSADSTPASTRAESGAPRSPDSLAASRQLVVLQTVRGLIVIRLDETAAPKTAGNFRRLVQQRYFDGSYFHAVYPGFKIHAGDPNTRNADPADDGQGGPGYALPPEIGLPCVRGAVAAARLPDAVNPRRESSGSQFFVLLADQPALDRGGYTVFGRVVRGLDVAEAIGRLGRRPELRHGRAGPNPERRALIGRAYLTTLKDLKKAGR